MNNLYTIALMALLSVLTTNVYAQSPNGVQYQAVVRNATGEVISSSSVGLQLSILQGSSSGSSVYTESHSATTNSFGLVNLQLGNGSSSQDFADIDWSNGPYFIKVEVDPTGGTSYVTMGTSQLLSVPYALHASTVANDSVEDDDADPANELLIGVTLSGTDLEFEDEGGTLSVDLSSLVEDDDADPENELLIGASLSGTDLEIEDAGATFTVDLSSLVDDEDADSTNEYQNLSFSNDELTLSGGGGSVIFPYDSSLWEISDDTVYILNEHVSIGGSEGGAMLNAHNTSGTGTNTAFYCTSNRTGLNRGILSYARTTSGNTANQYSIVGIAQNDVGSATSGTGAHIGVSAEAYATNGDNLGVQAFADGGGNNNYAVLGISGPNATIRNYGGYFDTEGTSVNFNIGVLTIADETHTGTNYGLYSIASGASTNYAAYLAGDVSYTGTLTSVSDRAFKKDVELYAGALEKVKEINTYTYNYKVDEFTHLNLPTGEQIGFVAQDLEAVYPSLVSEQHAPNEAAYDRDAELDGEAFTIYKGVNYIGMIPVLTQAIKEQQSMIESQQAQIEALELRLEALGG
ncbi:MAG: tail fiber domain-containing protein [Cyclobacteriaceae bacterium]